MLKIVSFIIAKLVAKAINANYSIFVLNSFILIFKKLQVTFVVTWIRKNISYNDINSVFT